MPITPATFLYQLVVTNMNDGPLFALKLSAARHGERLRGLKPP
jgi:hypothetical protein